MKILKVVLAVSMLTLFSSACFADAKNNWADMYTSNSNGQIALKNDLGGNVNATVNPTGSSAVPVGTTATQPAITTRIRLTVAVENSACSTPKDDIALNAARTLVLTCQSGIWKTSSGGATGLRGIYAPLKNKTIACNVGGGTAWASVDSTGYPMVRIYWRTAHVGMLDTGWVSGTSVGSGSFQSSAGVSMSVNGMSASYSDDRPTCDGCGGQSESCSAIWPAD